LLVKGYEGSKLNHIKMFTQMATKERSVTLSISFSNRGVAGPHDTLKMNY
jgi:hypothetical protein